jgi:DNA invertase Pin-like site-specific DNA recombinase
MLSLAAYAAEMERDRAHVRMHGALMRKAKSGRVTGGVVFGYPNRPVLEGGPRSHVERVADQLEAPVVRRIFGLATDGGVSSASRPRST